MKIEGVWLPIITPFHNGSIDFPSYVKLIEFFISKGISGIIPLATTGESPTIEEFEYEELLEKTVEVSIEEFLFLWDMVEIIRKSA